MASNSASEGKVVAKPGVQQRLVDAWDWYLKKLDDEPVKTKAFSAGVLGVLSEIVSRVLNEQRVLERAPAYVKQFFIAYFWRPSLHFWYLALTAAFRNWDPASRLTLGAKVLVHELMYHPVSTAVYMYLLRRLELKPHAEVVAHVAANFRAAQVKAWKVWPVVTVLNFSYVPPRLRVLFIQVVSVIMNAVLTTASKKH